VQADQARACVVVQQQFRETPEHTLIRKILQYQAAVTSAETQAKVVVMVACASEDVQIQAKYVGQVTAQAVVCVPKAEEQEQVGVLLVQHVDVVLQEVIGAIQTTMDIVALYVTNVRVLG